MFLYIVPLKQGLKLVVDLMGTEGLKKEFLYIVPLKQGLKRCDMWSFNPRTESFLYIDPLKQGLKHEFR